MTQKEIKKASNKLQKLWDYIRFHTENKVWDKIQDAVDLEIQLTGEDGR